MASIEELRDRLADLRDGRISLDQFEEWFGPFVWDIHKRADRETQDLAYRIGLKLAEYSSGDLEQRVLLEELAAASRPFVFLEEVPAKAASSATTLEFPLKPFVPRLRPAMAAAALVLSSIVAEIPAPSSPDLCEKKPPMRASFSSSSPVRLLPAVDVVA